MSRIALVVAVAQNGVIGNHGVMPWRIPEDMKHFKAVTMGKPIIMGRKTWESLPKKPLPGRTNIVVTRDARFAGDGAVVVHSLDDAIAAANRETPEEIAIIGGAQIYEEALPQADRIYLTQVHAAVAGDAWFAFDRAQWREASREDHTGDIPFSFMTLERNRP
ncbi:MAG TPA: dihydrofolate reductase [Rhizomicrobium sp.]|jgi:dihydrofolate reductase|nr:dihydrofolate reductase [Rhizomicrobium sp.]